MPAPDRRHPLHRLVLVGLAALALAAAACRARDAEPSPPTTTGAGAVAEHSRQVMPFDLARTTHSFVPDDGGLVETVETAAPADPDQVQLIRAHLRSEAERFTAGDYGDPARIHGDHMPGLAELRDGHDRVRVSYAETPAGARLTFASDDPALIDALHRWGAAQTADHGH